MTVHWSYTCGTGISGLECAISAGWGHRDWFALDAGSGPQLAGPRTKRRDFMSSDISLREFPIEIWSVHDEHFKASHVHTKYIGRNRD